MREQHPAIWAYNNLLIEAVLLDVDVLPPR